MTKLKLKDLNIAVIMGGTSAERQVSLNSGKAIINALKTANINVIALDGVKQLLQTDLNNIDAVFNILHGEAGENGELAALLSSLKVKYTGCDCSGAVFSWHKDIAKTIVAEKGLQTPQAQVLSTIDQLQINGDGPWIVKPTQEGSSVGLYYAKNNKQLTECVANALKNVDTILVEDFVQGTECTVAIIKNQVLPVIRIQPAIGLYDYQAKYENTGTQYFCPSGFNNKLEQALRDDAMTAFKALKLKGWARVDFIVDDKGNRWFLEANTTPGMTATSLVPKAAKAIGLNFNELVLQILSTAFDNNIIEIEQEMIHV